MKKNNQELITAFKAIADKSRLTILLFIYEQECKCKTDALTCRGETCIKDLSKFLGITTPTISHHIRELINAGLIITRKEGRWVYCKINTKKFMKITNFLNKFTT